MNKVKLGLAVGGGLLLAGGSVYAGANSSGSHEGAPTGPSHCGDSFSFQIGQGGLNQQTFLIESEMDPSRGGRVSNRDRATGWIALRIGGLGNGVEVHTSDPNLKPEVARKQLDSGQAGSRDDSHLQAVLASDGARDIQGQALLTPGDQSEVDAINVLVTGEVEAPEVSVTIICSDNA